MQANTFSFYIMKKDIFESSLAELSQIINYYSINYRFPLSQCRALLMKTDVLGESKHNLHRIILF